MRLTVDWLSPVLAANARLLQCVAPLGASSRVRRTARSTRSSPICRGAPGRISSPKPTIPSVIKRFRHIPTVKPVVRSLAATAALLSPLAHSRTMRARKASDRELRGCCSNCRKVIFCSGLTTSSRFLGRPRGFDMIHDNPSSLFMQSIYDSSSSHLINAVPQWPANGHPDGPAELHGLDVLPNAFPVIWGKPLQPFPHWFAARLRAIEDRRNSLTLVFARLRWGTCAFLRLRLFTHPKECTTYGTNRRGFLATGQDSARMRL